jgi:DNA-binding LytR/AlgR family response regulator
VCDDQPEQVELLLRFINDPIANIGERRVIASSKPVEFLQSLEAEKPDLVFLDINMDELDGIRLGEAIRARHPDAMIVYVTAFEQYALDAFRVRAFHYLLKPLEREAFYALMREARAHLEKAGGAAERHFTVQVKGETARFAHGEILYFEKVGHCVVVHALNREISYYGKIQSLLEELNSDRFVQCHQGYVVNLDMVRAFRDWTLKLEGGAEVPVSRSCADHVKSVLVRRLFDREGSL